MTDEPSPPDQPITVGWLATAPSLGYWVIWMPWARAATTKEALRMRALVKYIVVSVRVNVPENLSLSN